MYERITAKPGKVSLIFHTIELILIPARETDIYATVYVLCIHTFTVSNPRRINMTLAKAYSSSQYLIIVSCIIVIDHNCYVCCNLSSDAEKDRTFASWDPHARGSDGVASGDLRSQNN